MTEQSDFRVELVDYQQALPELRAVREVVFVQEQRVPLELEWDALDPLSTHVIARDAQGAPVGTGRLTPERKVGRMAVLPTWRNRRVGEGMLAALIKIARERDWPEVALNAQTSAVVFYARHGFVPYGAVFEEAGLPHQAMRLKLKGPAAIETRDAAIAITTALIRNARRNVWVFSHDFDSGLYDAPEVVKALRGISVAGQAVVRFCLQTITTPQRAQMPLIALAQRLPTVVQLRQTGDPVDHDNPSAFLVNDRGGYYFRGLGHRYDGEADLNHAGRARQLIEAFSPIWERALPIAEYRALGI